jgi:hypothetical protein
VRLSLSNLGTLTEDMLVIAVENGQDGERLVTLESPNGAMRIARRFWAAERETAAGGLRISLQPVLTAAGAGSRADSDGLTRRRFLPIYVT